MTTTAIANPAPLGLAAFGITTLLLSCVNAGLLPAGGEPVVIPLAMAFGGSAQLIAGVMEFKAGNTFGATAFTAYGAFWWWFALLLILGHNHVLDLSGASSAVGVCLLLWGVFTLGMWVSTFRLIRILFAIFLTLWIAFFLLGAGTLLGNAQLSLAGGWIGLVCGALALYASFALVTNSTFGREVVPVGTPR